MTTFQFILQIFNIFGIIAMTAFAAATKDQISRIFAVIGVVCFTLSLLFRLTATYIGG
jgi:hypothetical protein